MEHRKVWRVMWLRWSAALALGFVAVCASAVIVYRMQDVARSPRTAAMCDSLAWDAIIARDYKRAQRQVEEGLGLARRDGDAAGERGLLYTLATVCQTQREYQEAGAALERVIVLNRHLPDRDQWEAMVLSELADVYERYRPAAESEALLLQAMSIADAPSMTDPMVKRSVSMRYWSFLSGHGREEEALQLRARINTQWPGSVP